MTMTTEATAPSNVPVSAEGRFDWVRQIVTLAVPIALWFAPLGLAPKA